MNKEQKAAVVEEVAAEIQASEAIFAVDYRGISVPLAAELRTQLTGAGARFRVVKNTLTERAADNAGAGDIKAWLDGPTAFTYVNEGGDVALAAKALSRFRREHRVLEFKGGTMNGETLTIEQIESIARLPGREQLHGQLVGVVASPLTGLVRGLASLISGLAVQLQQIQEQGLVENGEKAEGSVQSAEGGQPAEGSDDAPDEAQPTADSGQPADEEPSEAPGDPVAEAEAAEQEDTSDTSSETPSEGETESEEG
jgi:large subunit ribosomal protein L10